MPVGHNYSGNPLVHLIDVIHYLEGLCFGTHGVWATLASEYRVDPGRIGDGSKLTFLTFLAIAKETHDSFKVLIHCDVGFKKKMSFYRKQILSRGAVSTGATACTNLRTYLLAPVEFRKNSRHQPQNAV